jgi:hypothetical protein
MSTATITAKPVTYKSSLLGTVTLSTYVDPHPGKIGTDRVPAPCHRCGGSGFFDCFRHVYAGRCFQCGGNGQGSISVATARKHARTEAFATEYADELAAYWAAFEAAQAEARKAAEFEAAWDEAHTEAARRAAMVQGFLAEVGEKVAGVRATVQVAKYIAGSYNRSSSMFLVLVTDAGQVVKVFGSSQTLFALERGWVVEIAGTVKKHEVWGGQDQTVLTHVKAVAIDEEVAA